MRVKLSDIRKIVREEMGRRGTKGVMSESRGAQRRPPASRSKEQSAASVLLSIDDLQSIIKEELSLLRETGFNKNLTIRTIDGHDMKVYGEADLDVNTLNPLGTASVFFGTDFVLQGLDKDDLRSLQKLFGDLADYHD
jgi:hypothetical protein